MASAIIYEEEAPANLQTVSTADTEDPEIGCELKTDKLVDQALIQFDSWATLISMANIAGPAFISMCLSEGQFQNNMMHVGHKGTNAQVIGIGLANMLIVTWLHTLAVGIASVLETLVS